MSAHLNDGRMCGVASLAAAFLKGEDTPTEALKRCLNAASRLADGHAVKCLVPAAEADAKASLARFARGRPLGQLDGIPLAVKDSIHVAGCPVSYGMRVDVLTPARDAAAVERLRRAGAVVFAKTCMHELACQPTGINFQQGTPVNPWAKEGIPGGSSSGSAVAVSSGIAAAALGTDAGGSIRVPAALNGLVGLKPTPGAVPEEDIGHFRSDIHQPGPLAWTVEDATLLFEAMHGGRLSRTPFTGRVAILGDFFQHSDDAVVRAVRSAIEEVFGGCPEVSTPACRQAPMVELAVFGQALQNMQPSLSSVIAALGEDTRAFLQLAGSLPAEAHLSAPAARQQMRAELEALFQTYDVLLAPACGASYAPLPATPSDCSAVDVNLILRLASAAFPANLTGLPACSVPCVREGLPVGLQLIGRPHGEAVLLSAARKVEALFGSRVPVKHSA